MDGGGDARARARGGRGGPPPREYTPSPRSRAGPARKEAAPTSPVLVRRSSVRFLASKRQIKEKWLHVHIDFCPQFAGCRGVGRSGWIGGSRVCGRTVGRLRVVAERETTNLCVPSSSSSFSAPSSTSSSSSTRSPPLFLFTSSVCLPAVSLSLCSYLLSPLSSFRPLFLRRTPFDYPCRPSTLSFLRSPFLLPFVARSLAHSLACLLARSFARPLCRPAPPICKLYPRSPRRLPCLPLSPSVCLASSFPSFIPSRRTPLFPSSFYPSSTSLSPR